MHCICTCLYTCIRSICLMWSDKLLKHCINYDNKTYKFYNYRIKIDRLPRSNLRNKWSNNLIFNTSQAYTISLIVAK